MFRLGTDEGKQAAMMKPGMSKNSSKLPEKPEEPDGLELDAIQADLAESDLSGGPVEFHEKALAGEILKTQLHSKACSGNVSADLRPRSNSRRWVEENLPLVIYFSKRYRDWGLELSDLIQEGTIGLLKAAERFDPQRGVRFSTYAAWWIRQALRRAIADRLRIVRVPEHRLQSLSSLRRAEKELMQRLGRRPTESEIALEMALLSAQDVRRIKDCLVSKQPLSRKLKKRWKDAAAKVREMTGILQEPVSLENPIGPDNGRSLGECIADDNAPDPVDDISLGELRDRLKEVLKTLNKTERQVLELRYGLRDGRESTEEETARILAVPQTRIRRIEAKALRMLRHPKNSHPLKEFL
jgi:RNA polymerase primary sigma factor